MGDRKYIFLSLSQLNAIQKSRALMTFLQTTLLRYNCIFSYVFWFLRIELGSMCNFRLSPSENSVSLDTLGISARNLAHYNISKTKVVLFTYELRCFTGTSLRENVSSDPECIGRVLQTLPLNISLSVFPITADF